MPEESQKTDEDALTTELQAIESTPLTSEPEPAVQNGAPSQSWMQEPKRKGRKLKFTILIAGLITFLGFGSWAAYALWYQSSDKIVSDALFNALTAKTVEFSGSVVGKETTDYTIVFEGKAGYKPGIDASIDYTGGQAAGAPLKLNADYIHIPANDNYLRVADLKSLSDTLMKEMLNASAKDGKATNPQIEKLYQTIVNSIIQKVDGQWLSFGIVDIRSLSNKMGDQYECMQKYIQSFDTDSSRLKDLSSAYSKNRFIKVKKDLGSKEGKVGFIVGLDGKKVKGFSDSLKSTKLYRDLKECSTGLEKMLDVEESDVKRISTGQAEIWVDPITHMLTSINATAIGIIGDDVGKHMKLEIKTTFNGSIKVNPPQDSIKFKDALPNFTELLGGMGLKSASRTTAA